MFLYQDCSSHLDSSKKHGRQGRGLFSLYIYIENLKIFLSETNGPISIILNVAARGVGGGGGGAWGGGGGVGGEAYFHYKSI